MHEPFLASRTEICRADLAKIWETRQTSVSKHREKKSESCLMLSTRESLAAAHRVMTGCSEGILLGMSQKRQHLDASLHTHTPQIDMRMHRFTL